MLRSLMLPKVPRTITSWFPRRDPYEYVNGKKVVEHYLNDGDEVVIGKYTLKFQNEQQAAAKVEKEDSVVPDTLNTYVMDGAKIQEQLAKMRQEFRKVATCASVAKAVDWGERLMALDAIRRASREPRGARGGIDWNQVLRDFNGLYDRAGLGRIREVLKPGGLLAVWSAYKDPRFVRRLQKSGFEARAQTVRARGRRGSRHTIFLGRSTS